GQDPRTGGQGNKNILGANKTDRYNKGKVEAMMRGLYAVKHHPAMAFDEVRNRPDFFKNLTRTLGGGQWETSIEAYAKDQNISWNARQFENDLKSGEVGVLNYLIPDQCDNMHGQGASVVDCDGYYEYDEDYHPIVQRGDQYVKYLVDTIKASPVWQNPHRRVAIVLLFDEGAEFYGAASCCGWNPGREIGVGDRGKPLGEADGMPDAANYTSGNKGDGPTI
ncbi:phosphoesterase, partial [Ralstonia pseudosolanacearum]